MLLFIRCPWIVGCLVFSCMDPTLLQNKFHYGNRTGSSHRNFQDTRHRLYRTRLIGRMGSRLASGMEHAIDKKYEKGQSF